MNQHQIDAIEEFSNGCILRKNYTFEREKYHTVITIQLESGTTFKANSFCGSSDWVYIYQVGDWIYILSISDGRIYVGFEAYQLDNSDPKYSPFIQGDMPEEIELLLSDHEIDQLAWYMAETYCY